MALSWSGLAVSISGLVVGLAGPVAATAAFESHCVVRVVAQTPDGQLIVGPAKCYRSLNEAQLAVANTPTTEADEMDVNVTLAGDSSVVSLLSFTLGIHYDGSNGTGSSITVAGSACSGGWWNTGASWANRISSSWNGCHRLRHYDGPNQGGPSAETVGVGVVHNLPASMNNKTESVVYLGS